MRKVYQVLDKAAECDTRLFWKPVKRHKVKTSRNPEIISTEGVSFRDDPWRRKCICDVLWSIYTPSKDPSFDETFYVQIESKYTNIETECTLSHDELPGSQISTNDILAVFNKLKRRNAPGPDLPTYEHLIFGGDFLNMCLLKIFNAIVYIGKIPEF